jgi:hypothetical protein
VEFVVDEAVGALPVIEKEVIKKITEILERRS